MEPTAVRFAAAVRALGAGARRHGLAVPAFRTPPKVSGATRTLRRTPRGAVVSVTVRGRPWAAVLGDLVEGVVVANGLAGPAAEAARSVLWAALPEPVAEAAA